MSQNMTERKIPSAMPIYCSAGAFVLGAVILPIYSLPWLLVTAALSVAAYVFTKRLFPPRVVMVPVPDTIYATGEQSLDETLAKAERDLKALAALNERIPDAQLSADIERMEKAGRGILSEVAKNPAKAKAARKFVAYYLPSSIKILTTYADLAASGAQGANTQSLMTQVKENTATIATAFETQLDALFADKVLDVSADLTVLDGMMKGDGLVGGDAVTKAAGATAPSVAATLAQDLAADAMPGINQSEAMSDLQSGEIPTPELKL